MRTVLSFICAAAFASAPAIPLRAGQTFRSGPGQVALIELYTSEGCSSCPPAEAWLGNLRNDPGLWRDFVPVAFHVNYWDRLGWRDALASKAFTDREYAYATAWNATSVYTPCFARNGVEWRPRNGPLGSERQTSNAGELTLAWDGKTNTCEIAYVPVEPRDSTRAFDLSLAMLGGGIVTNVRKGENAGRQLRHDFVALQLEKIPLKRNDSATWSGIITLTPRTDITTERLALGAWVTQRGALTPLQAAGGWLDEGR